MKIIVVSDTDKDYERYNNVVMRTDADCYIHLGDGAHEFADVAQNYPKKEFVFVKGDCDFCEASETQVLTVGKYKLFVTHGDRFDVSRGLNKLVAAAKNEECNIALFGHTHVYRTEYIDGIYLMNPGSLGCPRGHNKPSYGIIEINDAGAVKMNIVAY